MLSRIADSHFWMTRYVERTDGILRMLKINFITSLDRTSEAHFNWQPALKVFSNLKDEQIKTFSHRSDDVLRYMITNKENNNSIRNVIMRARENARGMQDHITKETWECMNEFYHHINSPDIEKAIERDEQIVMLSALIDRCLLFYGVAEVTMPRGQGWSFMNLGKFIERGIQTADILDVKFNDISYDLTDSADIPYYRNLLLSLSGYELYLKSYRTGLDSQNVIDMTLLNTDFPRSVLYCLVRLDRTLRSISGADIEATAQLQKMVGRLRSMVEYADIQSISDKGLHAFLSDVKSNLHGLSSALSRSYFAYD
jgi:uncharacterized alpha-E superfamily protein